MNFYTLKDVSKPNLLKNIFPYSLPPRIVFNDTIKEIIDGKEVEFDPRDVLKRDIHITDTTFRVPGGDGGPLRGENEDAF